jgi:hypothetical protein
MIRIPASTTFVVARFGPPLLEERALKSTSRARAAQHSSLLVATVLLQYMYVQVVRILAEAIS